MAFPPRAIPHQSAVIACAQTIAQVLGSQHFAVVGGAACLLLGSNRSTFDVDIVVPQGETKAARARLQAHPECFDVEKRTLHTFYRSDPPVGVEILTPPALFKESFSSSTPVLVVRGVRVLQPSLLLNAKCNSILGRARPDKKDTDAQDILFLLQWLAGNNIHPGIQDVPNASLEFVQWFIEEYGNGKLWINLGYDLRRDKT